MHEDQRITKCWVEANEMIWWTKMSQQIEQTERIVYYNILKENI